MQKSIIHKQAFFVIQLHCWNVKNTIKNPIFTLIAFTLQLIIIIIARVVIENTNKLNWIELNCSNAKTELNTNNKIPEQNMPFAKNIPAFYGYSKILSPCNQTGWNSFFQLKLMTNASESYHYEHNYNKMAVAAVGRSWSAAK